jgi:AcrR family transcriptional regulator
MVVKGSASDDQRRPGHRQRQALATRQQIGRAARELFASHGYVATTIVAISEAADIPVPTIYSAMGTKAKILEDIAWQLAATMDIDRHHEAARHHPDPAQGLRMAIGIQRRQYELMYDVIDVYQQAARTDPDIARSAQVVLANRERAFRQHLEAIRQHLAPTMTVARALDVYVAMVLPEIWRTLVLERRWQPARYEEWIADQLIDQLLACPVGPAPTPPTP